MKSVINMCVRAKNFQLLSFDKLQVLKLRIRTACSKLSYQSWMLKVVEDWKLSKLKVESCWIFESCQILKVVRHWKLLNIESCWILIVVKVECWKLSDIEVVECWKLLNLQSWILKVVECWKLLNVESWKLSNTVKVLNIESLLSCLLTSFQRR